MAQQRDFYSQRGVSAGKEDVHAAIQRLDKGLFPDAFCKILPDYLSGSDAHALIMHTDTAGTKPILAYMYWKETGDLGVWKGIVQDALVMNLDDMACSGALTDFVVSSNVARNSHRIPAEVLSVIINHAQDYLADLERWGVRAWLAGGETADVGDLVRTIDVGYTVTARLARKDVLRIAPKAGDVIVGIASYGQAVYEDRWNSGIGCNGLTSARHDLLSKHYAQQFPESVEPLLADDVVYTGKYKLQDSFANSAQTVGQAILSPTRTYLPLLARVLPACGDRLRGIVHCTGGGQTKCLHFAPHDIRIVKDNLLPVPHIFTEIQAALNTPWQQMFRTFNMGQRLELYTDEATASEVIAIAKELQLDAQVCGFVAPAEADKADLSIAWQGQVYDYNR